MVGNSVLRRTGTSPEQVRRGTWLLLAAIAAACMCRAVADDTGDSVKGMETGGKVTLSAAAPEEALRKFWFVGTSNYRVTLKASEAKIDRMLNRPGRLLFRGWEDPDTFKDWSDEGRIWDIWGGFGFEINEYVSWAIYSGGGFGTVKNRDHYHALGIPVGVRADFTRRSFFLGNSFSIYPWGRPERKGPGLMGSLRGARPAFEANFGFNYQYSLGDVSFSLPLIGRALHIEDQEEFYLLFFSPRVGLEFPINDRTTFNFIGGYTFFHDASDDFNSMLIEFFVRRSF